MNTTTTTTTTTHRAELLARMLSVVAYSLLRYLTTYVFGIGRKWNCECFTVPDAVAVFGKGIRSSEAIKCCTHNEYHHIYQPIS